MAIPSSRRVQTSATRISSVGKRTLGRMSHQSLLPSSMMPGMHQHGEMTLELAPAVEELRQAGARHLVEDRDPVGFQPRILPLPEGRGGAERQEMGKEIGELAHEVDAQLGILDPDMHMHAADDKAAGRRLVVAGQRDVALAIRRLLVVPFGEGMGGGGDRSKAMDAGDLRHDPAQPGQLVAGLGEAAADGGADLDLSPQELRRHPAGKPRLAFAQHLRRGIAGEVPAGAVDQQILLLDAEGEAGLAHAGMPCKSGCARISSKRGARRFAQASAPWCVSIRS